LCQDNKGRFVAVKTIHFNEKNNKQIINVENEIELLENIPAHQNIVQYLGVKRTQRHLYIMLEYVSCGSLTSIIQKLGSVG
jgi:serine/threonine protein kinase